MVKQTSAPQRGTRGISRLVTPDRLRPLQEVSWNLSAISYCIASVGRDLVGKQNEPGAMDAAGQALEWLAGEMQRRCVAIDEVLS